MLYFHPIKYMSKKINNAQYFLFRPHISAVFLLGFVILLASVFSTFYPIQAVVLSISAVILLFLILKPELPYYLLIILLHISYVSLGIYGKYAYLANEIFAFIALLLWCLSRITNLAKPYQGTSCDVPIILLIGLSLLSLLLSNEYNQLLKLFLSLGIFFLTISIVNNHRALTVIIWLIIAMGAVNSIFCFLSLYSYPDYTGTKLFNDTYSLYIIFNDPAGVGKRGHSFAHPLTTAFWLNFALIFSFGKYISIKGNKKLLLGILIFFMISAHLTTLSKGPLLALIGATLFLFYFIVPIRKRFFTSVAILIFTIATAFVLVNATQLKKNLFFHVHQMSTSGDNTSTRTRLGWWTTSITKSLENYGLGVGIGKLPEYLRPHVPHPHNVYVSVFGELGFIGIGLLVLTFSLAFKSYITALKQCRCEYYRRILLSYISGFLMLIFYIFTDYDYTTNLIWWYLGFGFAIASLAKEAPSGYLDENLPFFKDRKSICAIRIKE